MLDTHRKPHYDFFMMKNKETFGDRLCIAREQAGLSQTALAELILSYEPDSNTTRILTQQQINKYERGVTQPRLDNVLRLAQALEVDPYWLLYGEEGNCSVSEGKNIYEVSYTAVKRGHHFDQKLDPCPVISPAPVEHKVSDLTKEEVLKQLQSENLSQRQWNILLKTAECITKREDLFLSISDSRLSVDDLYALHAIAEEMQSGKTPNKKLEDMETYFKEGKQMTEKKPMIPAREIPHVNVNGALQKCYPFIYIDEFRMFRWIYAYDLYGNMELLKLFRYDEQWQDIFMDLKKRGCESFCFAVCAPKLLEEVRPAVSAVYGDKVFCCADARSYIESYFEISRYRREKNQGRNIVSELIQGVYCASSLDEAEGMLKRKDLENYFDEFDQQEFNALFDYAPELRRVMFQHFPMKPVRESFAKIIKINYENSEDLIYNRSEDLNRRYRNSAKKYWSAVMTQLLLSGDYGDTVRNYLK